MALHLHYIHNIILYFITEEEKDHIKGEQQERKKLEFDSIFEISMDGLTAEEIEVVVEEKERLKTLPFSVLMEEVMSV